MNKFKKAKTVFMASLIGLGAVLTGCGASGTAEETSQTEEASSDIVTFRLGYPATSSDVLQGLNGVAMAQGYFDEELSKVNAKIEAVPFAKAGPAINAALEGGELDGAFRIGDVPSIVAKASGSETTLIDIQPLDYSTVVITRKDLDITDVSELKGKTVAVQTSSYMQRILYQILAANGLSPEDVELVNMSEVEAATAVAAGSIDATAVTELKAAKLLLDDSVNAIFDTDGKPEMTGLSSTIVRTEFAEAHPDVVQAYFTALLRAQDYAAVHPEDLRAICVESGIEEDVVRYVYSTDDDFGKTVGTDDETKKNFSTVIDFLSDNGIISNKVDLDTWFDGSYYEKAYEEYHK